jgi:N-acetylmuramoyl-L-alanine amidase CwlA
MTTTYGGIYYNKCTNTNSISIEMCSNKTNKSSLGASDTDWYFTEATVNNAVELTKYLMKTYDISADNVISHHQVTGKVCPNPWFVNQSRTFEWLAFKKRLTSTVATTETNTSTKPKETKNFKFIEAEVLGNQCKFTGFTENNENWIKITSALEAIGYTTGWNNTKKRAITKKDGKEILLDIRTYISVDSISFSPLRELYEYLGYTVGYDNETKKITVK